MEPRQDRVKRREGTPPPPTTLWDSAAEKAMGHIEMARWADRIIVVPATADLLARKAGQRQVRLDTPRNRGLVRTVMVKQAVIASSQVRVANTTGENEVATGSSRSSIYFGQC